MLKKEKEYIVRAEGEIQSEKQVEEVVLISEQDLNGRFGRVTVNDMANVEFTYKEPGAIIRFLGNQSIAINAIRQTGANVIDVMDGIKETLNDLNNNTLPELGLKIEQVYDETIISTPL